MTQNHLVANKRLLVANRGEIAIRIFRAASELNMRTVAIYSYEDRFAMHRFKADEAYCLGDEGAPLDAYLNWERIIEFAIEKKIDAIHAGYGFLSENPEFAKACRDAGIMFCGPSEDVLHKFGDKVKARQVAKECGLPLIPGSMDPIDTVDEALKYAESIGYPVVLKAVSGGGGKGIRKVDSPSELSEAFERSRSEALKSFARADIYIEKAIENAKHIEIQIVGDCSGTVVHLYDRDCSIQRRNQKIVEIAPANGIPQETRDKLFSDSVKLGRHTKYVGVGTVEYLVDPKGNAYFLEVNPRIQVEHTVTEMITRFDIAQASIMLAAGRTLNHPCMGVEKQSDIQCSGVAVQCRITTEDPKKDFAPDTGKIVAYRPAQGFGIRLDEGMATQGGVITPHYDSLLVKVIAHAGDMRGASNKMDRALSEFRIRGVKTNIPLLRNVVQHGVFVDETFTTQFLVKYSEVFDFPSPQDRATKLLKFLAGVTINNPHNLKENTVPCRVEVKALQVPKVTHGGTQKKETSRSVFLEKGSKGLVEWVKNSKSLLLTDTTMRDAHQSLFATRLRTKDIIAATDYYRECASEFFSLEVWGGATFDTSLRFLKEDPWERLAKVRERVPNVLLQMLLRGDNAVGYTNYPEWVIRDFIKLTVESGLDVFRVFDCLNNPEQMKVAMDEVKKRGAIAEACLCYTGNILDPNKSKYDLKYYSKIAKELEAMGADILCIKDMAGLLRPDAASVLIRSLKDAVDLPIHLHTHATSGNADSMVLAAARAGCEIVDGAVSSMSGLTSQPSLNALVAALEFDDRRPELDLHSLDELSTYWESVRGMYAAFETNVRATTTRVYEHEIPGGQYSNLFDQARQVGVSADEFEQITERYKEVNQVFGDIVKVTPSSKVVGDMALLLHKNDLKADEWLNGAAPLDYPDSVESFFKGHMGLPYGGFPEAARVRVLGEGAEAPRKNAVLDTDCFSDVKKELEKLTGMTMGDEQVLSYRLYPKVYKDAYAHFKDFGKVDALPTSAFFFGVEKDQELSVDLEPGKTLIIGLSGVSRPDERGMRKVFFELNGFPREVEVLDEAAVSSQVVRTKASSMDESQIGAPMPGKIFKISAQIGQVLRVGDPVLILEAMKMEYTITAKIAGVLEALNVTVGETVEEADLLATIRVA